MPSNKKLLQAAAGSAGGDNLYVEDVFSTYLYAGNGNVAFDITNNIDLSGEGGMVWIKIRNATYDHNVFDTERGANKWLETNTSLGQQTATNKVDAFNADGFSLGTNSLVNGGTDQNYASWSFRKAEKFFDVVTYTGTGSERTVSHNLGAVPRIMIIKRTNGTGGWWVYSKDWVDANSGSLGVAFNLSNADAGLTGYDTDFFWGANPTDSVFSVGTYGGTNGNSDTYVAYLFASDAGGFGDDGDESIIKCGSFTGTSSGEVSVNLGWEPQFIIYKLANNTSSNDNDNWRMHDVMRGWDVSNRKLLNPNEYAEESSLSNTGGYEIKPTATGFIHEGHAGSSGSDYIYIAIRRPMKTPKSGTEVFSPYAYQDTTLTSGSGTASNKTILNGGVNGGTNFPVDLYMGVNRTGNHPRALHVFDRLRGKGKSLVTNLLDDEPAGDGASNGGFDFQEGVDVEYNGSFYYYTTAAGNRTHIAYFLKRATGFFDVVAYTGDGTSRKYNHNLGVTPELMIVKRRSSNEDWAVYSSALGATHGLYLNYDSAESETSGFWDDIEPTSTQFHVRGTTLTGASGSTYIAYLFASVDGVSKVGSYTGTGSDLNVDCGFSAGARFVLIKRTDSSGDWYYWDSARGIIAGNDPYQLMNSNAAEVTNKDYVDPLASGFTVTSSAPAALNASGGTYIFLAIA